MNAPPRLSVSPAGAADKHAAVQRMFGRIARRYDLMNTVMTGGLDGAWRRRTAQIAMVPEGGRALDVGTGTGDLAMTLARSAPGAYVVGLDYTGPMLALAPHKARERHLGGQTSWVQGDGQRLPFGDNTFDAVTSAFVLRNFADLDAALAEMARVVAPGGRVVALEISPGGLPVWRTFFGVFFQHLVPRLGALIAGDPMAYDYLPASVAAFLTPEEVADRMRAAGLAPQPPRRMMFGSLVIHWAVKGDPAAQPN